MVVGEAELPVQWRWWRRRSPHSDGEGGGSHSAVVADPYLDGGHGRGSPVVVMEAKDPVYS